MLLWSDGMAYKRILTIQDISCVGQCSLTVALPILSACGQEVCVLPSAVLSTHTGGFGKPAIRHLTEDFPGILQHWKSQNIDFDIIFTGYLGSIQEIECAGRVMDEFLAPGGLVVVDPAMADHGKLYAGFDEAYVCAMTQLCRRADIIIPNITEAAMMTGHAFQKEADGEYVQALLKDLVGPKVILTGVGSGPQDTGVAVFDGERISIHTHRKIEKSYHGTGDIFAAAFVGSLASGKSLFRSAVIAAEYTKLCIQETHENPAHWYGVKFEPVLPELIRMLKEDESCLL